MSAAPSAASAALPIDLPASLYFLTPVSPVAFRCHDATKEPLYFRRSPVNSPTTGFRFDDPLGQYGVLYCAEDAAGALAETILRQKQGRKPLISVSYMRQRKLSKIDLPPGLKLVKLLAEGLARNYANAEVTSGLPYAQSQAYGRALFQHPDRPDGIAYGCRHDNGLIAYVLFERNSPLVLKTSIPPYTLADDDDIFDLLRLRWGFVPVP